MSTIACNTDGLRDQALNELQHTLKTQKEFIKVHAAEYLVWSGYPAEVRKEFLNENVLHGDQPKYRIGIWRLLAQTETDPSNQTNWYKKVLGAFGDLNGPDRLHAAETLAKLKQSPSAEYPAATEKSLHDTSRNLQVYTHWALYYSPGADTNAFRRDFLQMLASDSNQTVRLICAYIVRKIKGLTEAEWTQLAADALAEPKESTFRKNLINTALVTFSKEMRQAATYDQIASEARMNYEINSAEQRIQLSQALAEVGNKKDLPLLASYLNDENAAGIYSADTKEAADVRAAAAYAIIKIDERAN